ncbi:MAG: hypothetical protein ACI8PB_001902 [Desulforhopalus sp.]|jgi:hypothetical protein
MSNTVVIIKRDQLMTLHTGTLMKRRDELLKCDESLEMSDSLKTKQNPQDLVQYKNTKEWREAYADVKEILSTREHVPNKKERKLLRQQKAKKR